MSVQASPAGAPALESPRARRSGGTRTNFELYGWLFMRLSGVLLLVLVFGHLFVQLVAGEGIERVTFAFVAGRWSSPFWQVWDLLMLWLAMTHGANGLRTIINDYAERDATRYWLKALLALSYVLVVGLGTLTIFTFDPCIDPESTLQVCQSR